MTPGDVRTPASSRQSPLYQQSDMHCMCAAYVCDTRTSTHMETQRTLTKNEQPSTQRCHQHSFYRTTSLEAKVAHNLRRGIPHSSTAVSRGVSSQVLQCLTWARSFRVQAVQTSRQLMLCSHMRCLLSPTFLFTAHAGVSEISKSSVLQAERLFFRIRRCKQLNIESDQRHWKVCEPKAKQSGNGSRKHKMDGQSDHTVHMQ